MTKEELVKLNNEIVKTIRTEMDSIGRNIDALANKKEGLFQALNATETFMARMIRETKE